MASALYLGAVCVIAGTLGVAAFVSAQTPFPAVAPATTKFMSREEAVRFALQNNPNLMVVRQQSGFAQAAIVSAKTYPFNPVYTGVVGQNGGPTNAMITNRVFNEHYVTLELELRGQGGYRRAPRPMRLPAGLNGKSPSKKWRSPSRCFALTTGAVPREKAAGS